MPDTERFIHIATVKGGHRFFLDRKYDSIALADWSGDSDGPGGENIIGRPDETDDGPLYLDFTRPIEMTDTPRGVSYSIPLYDESGVESSTSASRPEAMYAKSLGMSLREPCYTNEVTIHHRVARDNRFGLAPR